MVTKVARAVADYGARNNTSRLILDVAALVAVLAVAWLIYHGNAVQARLALQGKQAHDYLCYQKRVVIPKRIQSTLDYIAAVETGQRKPIPGLTAVDLQRSIETDEDTLRNLQRVHC